MAVISPLTGEVTRILSFDLSWNIHSPALTLSPTLTFNFGFNPINSEGRKAKELENSEELTFSNGSPNKGKLSPLRIICVFDMCSIKNASKKIRCKGID
jgi:hypothetical protein